MKTNRCTISLSDSIYHHGIEGQKWGVRNGPPYPLNDAVRSRDEQESRFKNLKLSLTDKQKKCILLGAAAVGALYLDYKTEIFGTTLRASRNLVIGDPGAAVTEVFYNLHSCAEGEASPKMSDSLKRRINDRALTETLDRDTGLYVKNGNSSIESDCSNVNPDFNFNNRDTSENCGLCSITYDMRRRGYDVTAGFSHTGTLPQDIRNMYHGVRTKHRYGDRVLSSRSRDGGMSEASARKLIQSFSKEKNTRGIIAVGWSYSRGAHAMAYEVLSNGEFVLICPQTNNIYKGKSAIRMLQTVSSLESIRTDNLKPNISYMKKKHIII